MIRLGVGGLSKTLVAMMTTHTEWMMGNDFADHLRRLTVYLKMDGFSNNAAVDIHGRQRRTTDVFNTSLTINSFHFVKFAQNISLNPPCRFSFMLPNG